MDEDDLTPEDGTDLEEGQVDGPAVESLTAPDDAEEFLGGFTRDMVMKVLDIALPALREAAAKTDTLVDDLMVDVAFAIRNSDIASDWLAGVVNSGIPADAMAVTEVPEDVQQAIFRKLPDRSQQSFGDGQLLKGFLELALPILLSMLKTWF